MRTRGAWLALVVALVALVVAVYVSGCRTYSPEDVQFIRAAQAVNKAHMEDLRLPLEARLIAQDAYDDWSVLRFSADGTPIPEDVQRRLEED